MTEHADKKEADRRLALLALAGGQPESPGPCPEAEELAALVEGRLATEEADACLAHIAACEACYALWLRLDEEWRHERREAKQKTGLLRLVGRPKVLTTVGSLLAAAASIAVLLTLTTRIDRARLPHPGGNVILEQAAPAPVEEAMPPLAGQQEKAAPPSGQDRLTGSAAQPSRSAGPANGAGKRKTMTELGRIAAGAREEREPASPASMAARERQVEGRAGRAAQAEMEKTRRAASEVQDTTEKRGGQQDAAASSAAPPAPAREGASAPPPIGKQAPADAAVWYDNIRRGCQGEPGADLFAALAAQGRQLLREPAALSGRDRQRIERIVAELGREQPVAGRCAALLELLEPTDRQPQP